MSAPAPAPAPVSRRITPQLLSPLVTQKPQPPRQPAGQLYGRQRIQEMCNRTIQRVEAANKYRRPPSSVDYNDAQNLVYYGYRMLDALEALQTILGQLTHDADREHFRQHAVATIRRLSHNSLLYGPIDPGRKYRFTPYVRWMTHWYEDMLVAIEVEQDYLRLPYFARNRYEDDDDGDEGNNTIRLAAKVRLQFDHDETPVCVRSVSQHAEEYAVQCAEGGFIGLWTDFFDRCARSNYGDDDDDDDDVQRRRLVMVDLSSNMIRYVHRSVFDSAPSRAAVRHIESLNLSNNGMVKVPSGLTRLRHLEIVDLSSNDLTSFAAVFRRLPLQHALSVLYLNDNQFEDTLPATLASPALVVLILSDCNISGVDFAEWQLPSLRKLDLSDNQLSALPDSVARLQSLVVLKLDRNSNLRALPVNALGALGALRVLYYDVGTVVPPLPANLAAMSQYHVDHGIMIDDDDDYRANDAAMMDMEMQQTSAMPTWRRGGGGGGDKAKTVKPLPPLPPTTLEDGSPAPYRAKWTALWQRLQATLQKRSRTSRLLWNTSKDLPTLKALQAATTLYEQRGALFDYPDERVPTEYVLWRAVRSTRQNHKKHLTAKEDAIMADMEANLRPFLAAVDSDDDDDA